jgi:hypothetical protein
MPRRRRAHDTGAPESWIQRSVRTEPRQQTASYANDPAVRLDRHVVENVVGVVEVLDDDATDPKRRVQ